MASFDQKEVEESFIHGLLWNMFCGRSENMQDLIK